MLTDFIGLNVPAVLILNLMDIAEGMGKKIDVEAIEKDSVSGYTFYSSLIS